MPTDSLSTSIEAIIEAGVQIGPSDCVELLVADVPLAQALFEGIPAARLLERIRLGSERSEDDANRYRSVMRTLLGGSRESLDRISRAMTRQARAAVVEGPLSANDGCIAALVYAISSSDDSDASLAEIFAPRGEATGVCDPLVIQAAGAYDLRFLEPEADRRSSMFEACIQLATRARTKPMVFARLRDLIDSLQSDSADEGRKVLRSVNRSIFPKRVDDDIKLSDRKMMAIERTILEPLAQREPTDVPQTLVRLARPRDARDIGAPTIASAPVQSNAIASDVAHVLSYPGTLVLSLLPEDSLVQDDGVASSSQLAGSWFVRDWSHVDTAAGLADGIERGEFSFPRVRAIVAAGGEPALDAIGAEMLRANSHPNASAIFAEILAKSARARDVIRLVTYFAVAPDPSTAAHVLGRCTAPELPGVLAAWLEAMLPQDGEMAFVGDDPETSSAAKLTACVASLAPHPHLYRAVRPLLARVSEFPPAAP